MVKYKRELNMLMTIPRMIQTMSMVVVLSVFSMKAFAGVDPAVQTADENRRTVVRLLVDGEFSEAVKVMDAWMKARPEDKPKIDLLRQVEDQVKGEPDEQKRKELIAVISLQQVSTALNDFTSTVQAGQPIGSLDPEHQ